MGVLGIHAFRVGQPRQGHGVQSADFPLLLGQLFVNAQRLLHLFANAHGGVQTGHGLLENDGQVPALILPHLLPRQCQQVGALKHRAAAHRHLGAADETHQRMGGHGLARAGLAHDANHLAPVHVQIEPVHGGKRRAPVSEHHRQVPNAQHHDATPIRSRMPSPTRPTPKMSRMTTAAGKMVHQGRVKNTP